MKVINLQNSYLEKRIIPMLWEISYGLLVSLVLFYVADIFVYMKSDDLLALIIIFQLRSLYEILRIYFDKEYFV